VASFLGGWIPITTIEILIPRDPNLLRGVKIVSTNLCGANEICGLSQDLGQYDLHLFCQGELEVAAPETIQEGGVSHPVF